MWICTLKDLIKARESGAIKNLNFCFIEKRFFGLIHHALSLREFRKKNDFEYLKIG